MSLRFDLVAAGLAKQRALRLGVSNPRTMLLVNGNEDLLFFKEKLGRAINFSNN